VNDTEIFEVVRRKTVEVLPDVPPSAVSIDGRLVDLGANSLDRVDIVTLTMDELGVVVPVTEFGGVSDLRSLVTLLGKYVP
jgi:polyketide biosynthesis acyl carrier protein